LQRLDLAEIDWRAVEHDPWLSRTGTPSGARAEAWKRELDEVARVALPGERAPATVPPLVSNTLAAVSAFAEAVTDGVQDALRRALFEAIWVRQRHLSVAYDVRPIITDITCPPYPILPYLVAELPPPGLGDPDPLHMTRVLGGTIAPNGIPLTTTGWRRCQQWRQEWLGLGAHAVPTVIDPTGTVLPGVRGLAYLADLLARPTARREETFATRHNAVSAPA
jgi:predicted DsbA family dithiol-disulfide isomerase